MKKLMKKLEDIMVAVTFAEAGEYDEARRQEGKEQSTKSFLHRWTISKGPHSRTPRNRAI